MTTVLWNELLICPVNFSFDTYFWKLFAAWNIIPHSFSQFWTVFPSFGREKQVYPSLSHFGREKQVLDGKNPTLRSQPACYRARKNMCLCVQMPILDLLNDLILIFTNWIVLIHGLCWVMLDRTSIYDAVFVIALDSMWFC